MRTGNHLRAVASVLAAAALAACGTGGGTATPPAATSGRSASMLTLTSPAFGENQRIPDAYASPKSGGEGRSLPFAWSGAPEGTRSFVLAFVDHAPVAHEWVHWCVIAIPAETTSLPEGASGTSAMPAGVTELTNTGGGHGYGGPNPPPGSGDHQYEATIYALSVPAVQLPQKPTAEDIQRALAGKVLAKASLSGLYSR